MGGSLFILLCLGVRLGKKKVLFTCVYGDAYVTGDKINLGYFSKIMFLPVKSSKPGSDL